METSTEKIIRLMLIYPKKRWKQKELAIKAGCSKAFLSKFTKKLLARGIITKLDNQIILLSPTKTLNYWHGIRELPKPIYIKSIISKERILKILEKSDNYCLTLFSAAWLRIKYMKTASVEAYVLKNKINPLIKKIGRRSINPTNIVLFPSDESVFEALEVVDKLRVVNFIQNYVDLMAYGGSGSRVAMKLSEKYKLLE